MKPVQSVESTTNFAKATTDAALEISKVSVWFLSLSAGIIGCWATASLITASINSGGPSNLFQNFITAVIG